MKKGDWHESVREPVINYVNGHDRSGRPDKKRGCTAIGLCLSRHEAAEVNSTEELKHEETNPTCEIHERLLHVTLKFETKIFRSDIFAQVNLISIAPTPLKLRIGLKRRQSVKSKVPAKQRGSWPKVCSN